MTQSDSDINCCLKKGYEFCLGMDYDGSIYKYSTSKMKIVLEKNAYKVAVDKNTKLNYNNSHKKQFVTQEKLSNIYNFEVWKVEYNE